MKNFKIICYKSDRSLKIKSALIKILKKNNFKYPNLSIVIGGDGFMLQILKKNKNSKSFFYGINSGNYGFLMNKFNPKNLIKNLSKAKMITISPLEMTVKNNKRQINGLIMLSFFGALGQTRTGTPKRARILSPLCLPISPRGHVVLFIVIVSILIHKSFK